MWAQRRAETCRDDCLRRRASIERATMADVVVRGGVVYEGIKSISNHCRILGVGREIVGMDFLNRARGRV